MITKSDVKEILTHADEQVLSIYLNVDSAALENQAATPAWQIFLKNAQRDVQAQLSDQAGVWPDIQTRLTDYFDSYTPRSKSLALFVSPDAEQAYELPVSLKNRAAWGKPLVTPLLWAMDEFERYLIVLVDQEKAHFLSAYLGSAEQEDALKLDLADYDWGQKTLMPATSATRFGGPRVTAGSNRDAFEDMIDAHIRRFYQEVADQTVRVMDTHKARRLVLGGSDQAAHAVKTLLPEKAAQSLVSVLSIPLRLSPDEVFAQVLPVVLDYERQREMELVEEVIGLSKSGGRGALGREMVIDALKQKQVELLVMPWPVDDELAHELPVLASESGGSIELVHGEAAALLNAEGGLGARLYYAP